MRNSMRMKAVSAVGLAAMLLSPAVRAEIPPIDARFIEPYSAHFEFVLLGDDGDRIPGGTWTDRVAHIEIEGRRLLRREVARFNSEGVGDLVRVMLADSETLTPVRTDQRFGPDLQSVFHVDYDGAEVTQILLQGTDQPAAVIDVSFEAAPYDLSLWATLAMALPFETGFETSLPAIAADRQSLAHTTLRVIGPETMPAMGAQWRAWKIEAVEPGWIFWVRKEKPYIVRIDHPAPGGGRALSIVTRFD